MLTKIRTPAAGFYGVAPDTFVLSVAAPANAASQAALLADLISPQTTALVWSVASIKAAGAKSSAADVKRLKSGAGTISAPAAVREYIAASAK